MYGSFPNEAAIFFGWKYFDMKRVVSILFEEEDIINYNIDWYSYGYWILGVNTNLLSLCSARVIILSNITPPALLFVERERLMFDVEDRRIDKYGEL